MSWFFRGLSNRTLHWRMILIIPEAEISAWVHPVPILRLFYPENIHMKQIKLQRPVFKHGNIIPTGIPKYTRKYKCSYSFVCAQVGMVIQSFKSHHLGWRSRRISVCSWSVCSEHAGVQKRGRHWVSNTLFLTEFSVDYTHIKLVGALLVAVTVGVVHEQKPRKVRYPWYKRPTQLLVLSLDEEWWASGLPSYIMMDQVGSGFPAAIANLQHTITSPASTKPLEKFIAASISLKQPPIRASHQCMLRPHTLPPQSLLSFSSERTRTVYVSRSLLVRLKVWPLGSIYGKEVGHRDTMELHPLTIQELIRNKTKAIL